MKYALPVLAIALTLAALSPALGAEADIEGATPGKWTMDLEAAKKVATEKDLPIMLNFSGSDWCGWCKIMEKNVYSTDEWAAYAKDNLLMVLVDFPRGEGIVPEKFKEQNDGLKAKYGIRGFPTFVILDSDGETELGRLRAGKEKTPEIVQGELSELFRYRDAEVKKYADSIGKEGKDYLEIIGELNDTRNEISELEESIAEAKEEIEELNEEITGHLDAARDFRAKQLGKKEYKEFQTLKKELDDAQWDLEDWMSTKPKQNAEMREIYQEKAARVSAAAAKLAKY